MITEIPAADKTQDVYTWSVVYDDGSVINEYDRPEGLGFAEVSLARVKQLRLSDKVARQSVHIEEDPQTHSMNLIGTQHVMIHSVDIPPDALPIFFRRRPIGINLTTDQATRSKTKHCIGWKNEHSAVYLFVFDDGSSLLTDDLQAV